MLVMFAAGSGKETRTHNLSSLLPLVLTVFPDEYIAPKAGACGCAPISAGDNVVTSQWMYIFKLLAEGKRRVLRTVDVDRRGARS